MNIEVIKTHRIEEKQPITEILDRYITRCREKTILAITSKIISICEGRTIKRVNSTKEALVFQEADAVLKQKEHPYGLYLTLKNNILIPSAGIDESNGDDVYILYPSDSMASARLIWDYLRARHQIKELGIIITDSHTTPLRRGVTGIAIAWCGFEPLYNYIGKPDIYGHPLRVTQINLIDALAASAVLLMGEGCEQTPIAVIQNAPKINFVSRYPTPEEIKKISISLEEDLYAPILTKAHWEKKK